MDTSRDIHQLTQQFQNAFRRGATDFHRELVRENPVGITGRLKGGWRVQTLDIPNFKFVLVTNVKYAPVIWRGRKFVNNRWYGSLQGWGKKGGRVLLEKHNAILQQAFNRIT